MNEAQQALHRRVISHLSNAEMVVVLFASKQAALLLLINLWDNGSLQMLHY